jgi:hypothetical protein
MPIPATSAPDERQKGLNDIKLSFVFYMIGGGLALIPVIGGLGGLLVLVGLIFFIVGWRALGRSTLAESLRYKSTGDWFIYTIVIIIVGSIVGAIIIAFSLIGSIINYNGPPPNPQTLYQSPVFRSLFAEIFALAAAASAVWLFPWYKAHVSLVKLAAEVAQPKLRTAGWLFFLSAVIGCVASFVLAIAFYSGLVTINVPAAGSGILPYYGGYYAPYAGFGFVAYFLIAIVNSVILVLASYLGYRGLKSPPSDSRRVY